MSVTGLVFLFLFGFSLGIPTGELFKSSDWDNEEQYPKVIEDHLVLNNLLVQWNKEGKIYLINGNSTASYSFAQRICDKYNMELVKIEDESKSRTLKSLLETYAKEGDGPFWMAGSRLKDGETWRWMDDQPITYFNWFKGEPNNAKLDEMCIELYGSAVWNDERCSIKNGFVCENVAKLDSGFEPILDSNDILDNEDDFANQPSRFIPKLTVSTSERPSEPHVYIPSTETVDLTEEVYDHTPLAIGTIDPNDYDYYTLEENEEDAVKVNPENTTNTTESPTWRRIVPYSGFRPSFGIPRYIPPIDDSEEYEDSSETDTKESFVKEGDKSADAKSDSEITDEHLDKESVYPRINTDYGREYFGKEW